MFTRKHRSCSAKTYHHFICYKVDSITFTCKACKRNKLRMIHVHRSSTLDQRFYYKSGYLLCPLRTKLFKFFCSFYSSFSTLISRYFGLHRTNQKRLIGFFIKFYISNRQSTDCLSVITVFERNEKCAFFTIVFMCMIAHLQCHFNST